MGIWRADAQATGNREQGTGNRGCGCRAGIIRFQRGNVALYFTFPSARDYSCSLFPGPCSLNWDLLRKSQFITPTDQSKNHIRKSPSEKSNGLVNTSVKLLRGGFNLDDLLTIIITAELANAMAELHLVAAGALDDARRGQLPMSAAARISSSLGDFSLRSGHSYTSSLFSTIDFNAEKGFVTSPPSWHVQADIFRFVPQVGQSPLQSGLHRNRIGSSSTTASLTASVSSNIEASKLY